MQLGTVVTFGVAARGLDGGARVLSQHARYRPVLASGQHVAASDDAKPAATQRGCVAHLAQAEPQYSAVSLVTFPLPDGQLPSIDRVHEKHNQERKTSHFIAVGEQRKRLSDARETCTTKNAGGKAGHTNGKREERKCARTARKYAKGQRVKS